MFGRKRRLGWQIELEIVGLGRLRTDEWSKSQGSLFRCPGQPTWYMSIVPEEQVDKAALRMILSKLPDFHEEYYNWPIVKDWNVFFCSDVSLTVVLQTIFALLGQLHIPCDAVSVKQFKVE